MSTPSGTQTRAFVGRFESEKAFAKCHADAHGWLNNMAPFLRGCIDWSKVAEALFDGDFASEPAEQGGVNVYAIT